MRVVGTKIRMAHKLGITSWYSPNKICIPESELTVFVSGIKLVSRNIRIEFLRRAVVPRKPSVSSFAILKATCESSVPE